MNEALNYSVQVQHTFNDFVLLELYIGITPEHGHACGHAHHHCISTH